MAKIKLFSILFIIMSILQTSCKKDPVKIEGLEIPSSVGENQIVYHSEYTLSYNETYEQADWVAYELSREEVLNDLYDRTDNFREDPDVMSGSAQLSDYYMSGYDRGHLAPAADMSWSETAMSESFFMSNMSPQIHAFNGGKWSYLEAQVREWADLYNGVYVVTGPELYAGLPTIGDNKVAVPAYFYKVIVKSDLSAGIGFILPNEDIDMSIRNFAVTIDAVEERTGINFFEKLKNSDQDVFENNINLSDWEFTYY